MTDDTRSRVRHILRAGSQEAIWAESGAGLRVRNSIRRQVRNRLMGLTYFSVQGPEQVKRDIWRCRDE